MFRPFPAYRAKQTFLHSCVLLSSLLFVPVTARALETEVGKHWHLLPLSILSCALSTPQPLLVGTTSSLLMDEFKKLPRLYPAWHLCGIWHWSPLSPETFFVATSPTALLTSLDLPMSGWGVGGLSLPLPQGSALSTLSDSVAFPRWPLFCVKVWTAEMQRATKGFFPSLKC